MRRELHVRFCEGGEVRFLSATRLEMSSPVIRQLVGEPSGMLRGKAAVSAYWTKALELLPDLHFELISILAGVTSLTLYYKGAHDRLAAEVFQFDAEQRVVKAFAHYDLSERHLFP